MGFVSLFSDLHVCWYNCITLSGCLSVIYSVDGAIPSTVSLGNGVHWPRVALSGLVYLVGAALNRSVHLVGLVWNRFVHLVGLVWNSFWLVTKDLIANVAIKHFVGLCIRVLDFHPQIPYTYILIFYIYIYSFMGFERLVPWKIYYLHWVQSGGARIESECLLVITLNCIWQCLLEFLVFEVLCY